MCAVGGLPGLGCTHTYTVGVCNSSMVGSVCRVLVQPCMCSAVSLHIQPISTSVLRDRGGKDGVSAVLWAPQERPVKLVRKAITQQTLTKVGQPEI